MSFKTYFNEMARPLGSKKLSPDLIKAINDRIAGGDTFVKIANDFFLSPWLVKKIADSQGVTHPRGRRPGVAVDPEKIENIMRRIESGEKFLFCLEMFYLSIVNLIQWFFYVMEIC